jgi:hypothetical protein
VSSSRTKGWPVTLALAFVVWTAVGAFFVSQRYLFALSVGARFDLVSSAIANFPSVWLWAVITPLIMELSRRFPLQGGDWHKYLLFHFLLSLGFGVADVSLDMLVANWTHSAGPRLSLLARFWNKSFINVFSYGAVAAVAHALQYSRQLAERKARAAELEKEVLSARLTALQRQLQPHFLFNALNSVASLIRAQQGPQAVRALTGLADLLRFVLKREGRELVALREEMELVDRYLRIEQIRFENRLEAKLHVDPGLLDALVPSLILQPLVENAVHHGIDSTQVSKVEVTVERNADMLCLSVQNTGAALDLASAGRAAEGVGLSNTRARLQHLYGERYRLELRAAEGGGALAELAIPFHPEIVIQEALR